MTTPGPSRSAVSTTPPADAMMIATSVLEQTKDKDEGVKVAVPDFFKGDHKDTY
uniref:Uncharacterized protein n=1 Tax=Moniliophthora roreri TaxID=221103 RepID=A0A0W0EU19_MONRR